MRTKLLALQGLPITVQDTCSVGCGFQGLPAASWLISHRVADNYDRDAGNWGTRSSSKKLEYADLKGMQHDGPVPKNEAIIL